MNSVETVHSEGSTIAIVHPDFGSLIQKIIQKVDKNKLTELRQDFHTRLRLTLTQPDRTDLIEDLWNFFYDWCVFEEGFSDGFDLLSENEKATWEHVKSTSQRGLFLVQKVSDDELKLKEQFSGKSYQVAKKGSNDFIGISRGDFIEGRLVVDGDEKNKKFSFVRRPSYHPIEVHNYIKKKIRQFKKSKDFASYQSWLWLLVGMYLKHRLYNHMPIEKIYDDNSRI